MRRTKQKIFIRHTTSLEKSPYFCYGGAPIAFDKKQGNFLGQQNAFFSIWAQNSPYWLVLEGPHASQVEGCNAVYDNPELCAKSLPPQWVPAWKETMRQLFTLAPEAKGHRAAVIPSTTLPSMQEVELSLRSISEIETIARNLWLIESLQQNRLCCYLQRVIDRRGKAIGFEAFARVEAEDGTVISGFDIMQAATALHMEYQLDKLLHKQAIDNYIAHDLDGSLFINFLTGFVQRPEVYLDGLAQAASRHHMRPGMVVLDVPFNHYAHDLQKLTSIADYCRSRRFALALDDVMTTDGLAPVLEAIRPAFIKLHGGFAIAQTDIKHHQMLQEIIAMAHGIGACVLAENVETQPLHDFYFAADVDMFQGYLFGAPQNLSHDAAAAKK